MRIIIETKTMHLVAWLEMDLVVMVTLQTGQVCSGSIQHFITAAELAQKLQCPSSPTT